MFRRKRRVQLDARLSWTGEGSALLVLPADSLVISPDPFGAGNDGATSPTLDLLAELTPSTRFGELGESLLARPIDGTEEPEVVAVRVTVEVAK